MPGIDRLSMRFPKSTPIAPSHQAGRSSNFSRCFSTHRVNQFVKSSSLIKGSTGPGIRRPAARFSKHTPLSPSHQTGKSSDFLRCFTTHTVNQFVKSRSLIEGSTGPGIRRPTARFPKSTPLAPSYQVARSPGFLRCLTTCGVKQRPDLLPIDSIEKLMRKNGERVIPSFKTDQITLIFDIEGTIADWKRPQFDWGVHWKSNKIGSDLFNKIKGTMFNQIRSLLKLGWTKEEVIERLVRGYFVPLSEEEISFEGTEWSPDCLELITNIQADKYTFVLYTHAMATFGAYEAKEFLRKLEQLALEHHLNVEVVFICGSDLTKHEEIDLYRDIELEVINRVRKLNDPKGHLKNFLKEFDENFTKTPPQISRIPIHCLPQFGKDDPRSWDFVFKNILKVDPAVCNVALFDDQKKHRDTFLDVLRTARRSLLPFKRRSA